MPELPREPHNLPVRTGKTAGSRRTGMPDSTEAARLIPPAGGIVVVPVTGIGEVTRTTDLAAMIASNATLSDGDVVVVTQKIVSKAEGRMVDIDPEDADAKRRLVESESVRILRRRGGLLISETQHGFICANAGVDLSNVPDGWAALLPVDSDRSARKIRERLRAITGATVAVIVSDTFGRAFRRGVVDVAIGCDGVAAILDLRGTTDANGRELVATEMCIADEIASAAELVMGKDRGVPVAIVRGIDPAWLRRSSVAEEITRPASEDLFR